MHIIMNKPKEDYYCVATIKIILKGNAFIPMQKMGQSNQTLLSSICNVSGTPKSGKILHSLFKAFHRNIVIAFTLLLAAYS